MNDSYYHVDISYQTEYGQGSGELFTENTLVEAIEKSISSSTYYLGIGKTNVRVKIHECCISCSGKGEVLKKTRKNRTIHTDQDYIKCKSCSGVGRILCIPEFEVRVNNHMRIQEIPAMFDAI